eukprot:SAG22_NODE_1481_length_4326_cov_2.970901_3_plen_26_part_01
MLATHRRESELGSELRTLVRAAAHGG